MIGSGATMKSGLRRADGWRGRLWRVVRVSRECSALNSQCPTESRLTRRETRHQAETLGTILGSICRCSPMTAVPILATVRRPSKVGDGRIDDQSTQLLPGTRISGACRTLQPVSETCRCEKTFRANISYTTWESSEGWAREVDCLYRETSRSI